MRKVVNVIRPFLSSIGAVPKVKDPKNKPGNRYWNKIHINAQGWIE